jgi:hypothetical protein
MRSYVSKNSRPTSSLLDAGASLALREDYGGRREPSPAASIELTYPCQHCKWGHGHVMGRLKVSAGEKSAPTNASSHRACHQS